MCTAAALVVVSVVVVVVVGAVSVVVVGMGQIKICHCVVRAGPCKRAHR